MYIILCYYSVCVLLVNNHLCGWNSCDVMLYGNNIRNWFMILCIAVNIILTGNETYDTRCMSKMTAVYCMECIEVRLPGI